MKKIILADNIITLTSVHANAMVIEDGIIQFVGTQEECLKKQEKDTEILNFEGKTILPGFIDAHSHISQFAQTIQLANLDEVINFDEIIDRCKRLESSLEQKEEWCIGFGYDHNFLIEKQHPTSQVLNQISSTRPVMIVHTSGHMGVVNDVALKRLHIDANTPNPQGGKIGRDENGNPNGYLEETAFTQLTSVMPKPQLKDLFKQWEKAQTIYHSFGITTAQDGLTKRNELEFLKALANAEKLTLDVVSYIDLKENASLLEENKELEKYHHRLRIGGGKIFLDGSPQGRTAWMQTPYQNDSSYYGYPIYSNAEVEDFIRSSFEKNTQLLCHCNGDAAAQQFLDCTKKIIQEKGENDTRPVMIHAQLLRPDQLDQLKACAMIPSFFIAHVYYWGDIHIQNFGFERAQKISCAHSALQKGIPFTFHQDTPVLYPNMLETIDCAVNRVSKKGVLLGADERISALDAIKAVTLNAALQYHEEKRKGSLEIGKLADFVVLDQNPLTIQTTNIKDIQVLATYKEGVCVYKKA